MKFDEKSFDIVDFVTNEIFEEHASDFAERHWDADDIYEFICDNYGVSDINDFSNEDGVFIPNDYLWKHEEEFIKEINENIKINDEEQYEYEYNNMLNAIEDVIYANTPYVINADKYNEIIYDVLDELQGYNFAE